MCQIATILHHRKLKATMWAYGFENATIISHEIDFDERKSALQAY